MARCRCSSTHSRCSARRGDSSVTSRRTTIRRLLIAASIAFTTTACRDPGREMAARPQTPTRDVWPPDYVAAAPERLEPNHVLPPEGADRPADANVPPEAQIARESASDAALEPNHTDWSGGDPAHGQALFATHCAICHGGGGAGDG